MALNSVVRTHTVVRTVYLYIFSLIGLVLFVIGAVGFANMALRQFVFTRADDEQRMYGRQPPVPPIPAKLLHTGEDAPLTPEERESLRQWLRDYGEWKETTAKVDPVASRRQRDAATNLALILVGVPLYAYHWRLIKREAAGL